MPKTLTKKQKSRIVFFMCGKKVASDFDFYPWILVDDITKVKVFEAVKFLFAHNNIDFKSDKISDYWKRLAQEEDWLIPSEKEFRSKVSFNNIDIKSISK